MRKIKLIWDFRGEAAAKTAEHHDIHLNEYLEKEKYLKCCIKTQKNYNFLKVRTNFQISVLQVRN